jgi:hypothetical protein
VCFQPSRREPWQNASRRRRSMPELRTVVGTWGTREEAKQISNRLRREQDRRQIAEQVLSAEPDLDPHSS